MLGTGGVLGAGGVGGSAGPSGRDAAGPADGQRDGSSTITATTTPQPLDMRAAPDLTTAAATGNGAANTPNAVGRVFDTTRLHTIDIVLPAPLVPMFETGKDLADPPRFPATFTFDGVTLTQVGIRQGSGGYQAFRKINDKPSISIDFNKFVPKQHLFGLKRLYLKNEAQDKSLVNEHMTYEVFRRAGHPASLTAHALVTINGVQSGIYLIRENKNQDFLERTLGTGFEKGNLYEQTYGYSEFADHPLKMNLKNEREDMRKRDDLVALANAVQSSSNANFAGAVGKLLDVDQFISYWALCAATAWLDSYTYNANNYFLYNHPKDNRFIFISHGADAAFWASDTRITSPDDIMSGDVQGRLASKMRAIPDLYAKFKAEVKRVGSPAVWDVNALLARVAQVGEILKTAPRVGRASRDLAAFETNRPIVDGFIRQLGLTQK